MATDVEPSPRSRQSKRDDILRKKIELELSKKRSMGTKANREGKPAPGTVLYLRPFDPITCGTTTTAFEAAQLMSINRENCILVVGKLGDLIGIFTARDLAFRIVGLGLNASTVTIDQIMTPDPQCAYSSSPASEALNLMVQRGFRHLPVLDGDGHVSGVLDITKSYAQQMEKLERLNDSSKKLYEALDLVHTEMGSLEHPRQVFEYFADLKAKMNGPTLLSVLDDMTSPVYINTKTTVYEATLLMKDHRTTAVLVKDATGEVSGIFTSKDVTLRVIAAGLDPKRCSIVRVMTTKPKTASHSTTIQSALRQMSDGGFLNLPVTDEDKKIVGIVDVLKLTYAALNQIEKLELGSLDQREGNNPAWEKFWASLDNNDSRSSRSASASSALGSRSFTLPTEFVDSRPSRAISVDEDLEQLRQSGNITELGFIDYFVFKFRSPTIEDRVYRVALRNTGSLAELRGLIAAKLHPSHVKDSHGSHVENYIFSYVDDEGDVVFVTSDADLKECIVVHRMMNQRKADICISQTYEADLVEMPPRGESDNKITLGFGNALLITAVIGLASLTATFLLAASRRKS